MNTITSTLAILAIITATFNLIFTFFKFRDIENDLIDIEDGLRECATRSSMNKLDISTIDNRTKAKPKAKRGRPKKNAPKPHELRRSTGTIHSPNGKQ